VLNLYLRTPLQTSKRIITLDEWLCTVDYAMRFMFEDGKADLLLEVLSFLLNYKDMTSLHNYLKMELCLSHPAVGPYRNLKYLFRSFQKSLLMWMALQHVPKEIRDRIFITLLLSKTWS
jgi:hypothetical protein